jgi:hypothetical protein
MRRRATGAANSSASQLLLLASSSPLLLPGRARSEAAGWVPVLAAASNKRAGPSSCALGGLTWASWRSLGLPPPAPRDEIKTPHA